MTITRTRKPTHPGAILRRMHMEPMGLTVTALARYLGVSRKHLSQLLHEKVGVTTEMALRLSKTLGTTPELWLNLQRAYDLHVTMHERKDWQSAVPVPPLGEDARTVNP
jgi:antitoxin HigA-1